MSQPATAAPGGATAAPLQPPAAAPPQPTPSAGPSPASPAEVTPVSTAEELRTAAAAGAQHIEIRAHLDLRELPRADNPLIEGNGARALALLYASGDLESIRGNCQDHAPALSLARSVDTAASPDLVPLLPGQCLLLVSETWLMVNKGAVWVDNVYLKVARRNVRPSFALITAGALDNRIKWPLLEPSDIYVTDVTFQADPRTGVVGVTTDHLHTSVYIEGCVFTDWAADYPPLAVKHESVAGVHNTIFRNTQRVHELVDVSFGGTVSFSNATLGNITLNGGIVVGTTANDYSSVLEPHSGHLVTYYEADDGSASGVIDVRIETITAIEDRGAFRGGHVIADGLHSDCLYQRTAAGVLMPGCPDESLQQRQRVRDMSPLPPGGGAVPGFEFFDPWAHLEQRLLLPNSSWLAAVQQSLPAPTPPAAWPPPAIGPPFRGQPVNPIFAEDASLPPDVAAAMLDILSLPAPGDPPPWLPASGRRPIHIPPSLRSSSPSLREVVTAVAVALVLLMSAATAAVWLWLKRGRPVGCRARSKVLSEGQLPAGATKPEDILVDDPVYHHQRQDTGHGRTDKGAADPASTAVQPRCSMNPDYEYCLPRHLALFAQPFSTGGTRTDASGHRSVPGDPEPGSTVVLPPYTVSTAPGVTSHSTDSASSRAAQPCLSRQSGCTLEPCCAEADAGVAEIMVETATASEIPSQEASQGRGGAAWEHAFMAGGAALPQEPLHCRRSSAAAGCEPRGEPDDGHLQNKLKGGSATSSVQQGAAAHIAAGALQLQLGRSISLQKKGDLGYKARRLERQLDLFKSSDLFLGELEMLGRRHRRRGGQAVVQFALGSMDSCQYAIKFFLDREAFAVEAALYAACFPHIRNMVPRDLAMPALNSAPAPHNHDVQSNKTAQELDGYSSGASASDPSSLRYVDHVAMHGSESSMYTADAAEMTWGHVMPTSTSEEPQGSGGSAMRRGSTGLTAQPLEIMPQAVAKLLPQVEAVFCGEEGALARPGVTDPRGRPLPPCIVMEKGESLQDWSERAEPDRFAAIAVLANISKRLADLHAAGFVHRDLKPANVMWLPRQNRWTLIDFGCVARVGAQAPLSFTLAYAAPEVAAEYRGRRPDIEAQPALDTWSLGIMAFELLTRAPAFNMLADGCDGVLARLTGERPFPWEGPGCLEEGLQRKLGAFKGPVLQLLERDPARRASMQAFHASCNKLFTGQTTSELAGGGL